MAVRHTAILADQIDDNALTDGLKKNVSDDTKMQVAIKDNDGLTFDTAELTVNYDDSTIGIKSNQLAVKDGGIDTLQLADEAVSEAKLDIYNSPTDGYYLKYTTANGMEWAEVTDTGLTETDFVINEIPSGLINSSNVTYTLANTPEAGTEQVFLNGLLQAPGSGLDYTISGGTITFVKAPHTNSDLYVTYIKQQA